MGQYILKRLGGSIMKNFWEFMRIFTNKKQEKYIYFVIIEKLKPWIVLNCLKKENYLITDSQAEKLTMEVLKQAISRNALGQVLRKLRYI